eukprot:4226914-Prymnesium_polylepis.1
MCLYPEPYTMCLKPYPEASRAWPWRRVRAGRVGLLMLLTELTQTVRGARVPHHKWGGRVIRWKYP